MKAQARYEAGAKEAEEFLDYFFGLLASRNVKKVLLAVLLFGIATGCVKILFDDSAPLPPETY